MTHQQHEWGFRPNERYTGKVQCYPPSMDRGQSRMFWLLVILGTAVMAIELLVEHL